MGTYEVNVEFRAHGQAAGGESQSVWFHYENAGIDEVAPLSLEAWSLLRAHTQVDDRAAFEIILVGSVTPSPGWSEDWKAASWRAACRMWST